MYKVLKHQYSHMFVENVHSDIIQLFPCQYNHPLIKKMHFKSLPKTPTVQNPKSNETSYLLPEMDSVEWHSV